MVNIRDDKTIWGSKGPFSAAILSIANDTISWTATSSREPVIKDLKAKSKCSYRSRLLFHDNDDGDFLPPYFTPKRQKVFFTVKISLSRIKKKKHLATWLTKKYKRTTKPILKITSSDVKWKIEFCMQWRSCFIFSQQVKGMGKAH